MTRIIVYASAATEFKVSAEYTKSDPPFAWRAALRFPVPMCTNAVVIPQRRHCPPAAFAAQTGKMLNSDSGGKTNGKMTANPETNPIISQTILNARRN